MKKITMGLVCKNFLEKKGNENKINVFAPKVISAEKRYRNLQKKKLKEFNKHNFFSKLLFLHSVFAFLFPYYSYSSFRKSLFSKNHLYFEKFKDSSLLSFVGQSVSNTAILRNSSGFGKYCERALSPYFMDTKTRFHGKVGKNVEFVMEPDYVDNSCCYEFKAISRKDMFDKNFKLAYCQANLGLLLSKPSYDSNHEINFQRTVQRVKGMKVVIEIYSWFEDGIYRYELEPDFSLAYEIYLYAKSVYDN